MQIQQFREAVYQSIRKRADAFLDLLDALTVAGHVESPVALSEEQPFRRKFSSIFDTLLECEFYFDQLINQLHHSQPANSETIAMKCMPSIARPMNVRKRRRWKIVAHSKPRKMSRCATGTSIRG